MNTTALIRAAQRMNTLSIRLAYTDDIDGRRIDLICAFKALATDADKIATRFRNPEWNKVHADITGFYTEAVHADEARVGTMYPVGRLTALVTSLHALAATLGFVLDDAATAPIDEHDDAAAAHVEMRREAAE